jgi:hypothetical protein
MGGIGWYRWHGLVWGCMAVKQSSFAMELQICDLKIGETGNNKFDNGKAFKIADSLASRQDATFPSSFSFLICGSAFLSDDVSPVTKVPFKIFYFSQIEGLFHAGNKSPCTSTQLHNPSHFEPSVDSATFVR